MLSVVRCAGVSYNARYCLTSGSGITNCHLRFRLELPGEDDLRSVPGDDEGSSFIAELCTAQIDSGDKDRQVERNPITAPIEFYIRLQLGSMPFVREILTPVLAPFLHQVPAR
jgi:hypothetical protein